MKAKDIWAKIIFGNYYLGSGNQPIEDEVNAWLQQDAHQNFIVHDIIYQHCNYGSGIDEKNVASVMVIYEKRTKAASGSAKPIETLTFKR